MKKGKKLLVLVLALVFLLSVMMTGCGKTDSANSKQTQEQSVAQSSVKSTQTQSEQLPKELVVSSFNWGWPTVDESKDRIGPELEKALGFKVKLNVIKAGSADEADKKLQLWASTGAEDMPDILMTNSSTSTVQTIDTLGRNDVLLDWNTIIDKMPNYKSEVNDFLPVCRDVQTNKIFRVPQNFASMKASPAGQAPLIRKDWLDKLGLAVPKTTDELYEVLKAFRDKIKLPDGSKVIPMIAFGDMFWNDKHVFDNPSVTLASSGNPTGGLNDWFTDKDGIVKRHDMVYTDNLIAFVSFYNKLYKEDLLDKECFTMKYGQFEEKNSSGKVGSYTTWGSHVQTINDALAKTDPNAMFIGVKIFDKNITSEFQFAKSKLDVYSYWIVKKNIPQDQLNGLIKYFNYTMGDEGFKLTYYGVEGVDWQLDADGKIVDTKESVEKYKGNLGAKIPDGIWYYSPTPNFTLIKNYYAPTAFEKRKDMIETWKILGGEFIDTGYITDKAAYVIPGPIEQKKGAGYADRWKDMVVKGVMAKSSDEIKQIVTKWQDTERKLGYDEVSAERTSLLSTVPDLNVK
jgi:ABC-type sugar transport system, periplasmic component